jgi:hypothetical protein
MNNFDKYFSTPEKVAEFLDKTTDAMVQSRAYYKICECGCPANKVCNVFDECQETLLNWLNSEVKEGENE